MWALSTVIPFRLGPITSQIHGILRIHSLKDIGTIFSTSKGHHPLEVDVAAYVGRFASCIDDGVNFSDIAWLVIRQLLSSHNLALSLCGKINCSPIVERPASIARERSGLLVDAVNHGVSFVAHIVPVQKIDRRPMFFQRQINILLSFRNVLLRLLLVTRSDIRIVRNSGYECLFRTEVMVEINILFAWLDFDLGGAVGHDLKGGMQAVLRALSVKIVFTSLRRESLQHFPRALSSEGGCLRVHLSSTLHLLVFQIADASWHLQHFA